MSTVLTGEEAQKILDHWFNTKPNAYVGYRYARNFRQLLLKPMTDDVADTLLQWLVEDIPLFKNLSSDQLRVVSKIIDFEKKAYYIMIGNHIVVPIPTFEA